MYTSFTISKIWRTEKYVWSSIPLPQRKKDKDSSKHKNDYFINFSFDHDIFLGGKLSV